MICGFDRQSDHRPGLFQLLGSVHRQRGAFDPEGGNGEAGLDQPQLLEPFKILQRRSRQLIPAGQHISPEAVHAHMPPVGGVLMPIRLSHIPHVGDGGP